MKVKETEKEPTLAATLPACLSDSGNEAILRKGESKSKSALSGAICGGRDEETMQRGFKVRSVSVLLALFLPHSIASLSPRLPLAPSMKGAKLRKGSIIERR